MIVAEMTPAGSCYRSAVSTNTPAKINLTLDVLGQRADGYHELRSLVIGVDLRDKLRVSLAPGAGPSIKCGAAHLSNENNLAVRAAVELAKSLGRSADVAIELTKRIPVGGGLGGGSSDAAATLRLCNHVWEAGLSDTDLAAIGSRIGSDVPLFFRLPSAVMTGRGETVTPAPMCWKGWVFLLLPGIHVSTADVYRAWRRSDSSATAAGADALVTNSRTASEMAELLSNQLEPAVFRVAPQLLELRREVERCAGGPVRVSGSGSSMYVLFDDPQSAHLALARVRANLPQLGTVVAEAPVGEGPLIWCQ